MKIQEIRLNYSEPKFPGGMKVTEMETILKNMDWEDGDQVAKEARRCNDRCQDITVDVPIPWLRADT